MLKRILLTNLWALIPAVLSAVALTDIGFDWLFGSTGPAICTAPYLGGLAPCKVSVRIGMVALAFIFKVVQEAVDSYYPLRRMSDIQQKMMTDYVDPQLEEFTKECRKLLKGTRPGKEKFARISVMVLRRRWWLLWLWPRFEFVHRAGFSRADPDRRLWLFKGQGVASEAVRTGELVTEYFSPPDEQADQGLKARLRRLMPSLGPHRLFGWQRSRTRHVRWILAIPILRKKNSPLLEDEAVGAINIDVTDAVVADQLRQQDFQTWKGGQKVAEKLTAAAGLAGMLW
jgi:hypothetical protein